jgi:hypothetical protein
LGRGEQRLIAGDFRAPADWLQFDGDGFRDPGCLAIQNESLIPLETGRMEIESLKINSGRNDSSRRFMPADVRRSAQVAASAVCLHIPA